MAAASTVRVTPVGLPTPDSHMHFENGARCQMGYAITVDNSDLVKALIKEGKLEKAKDDTPDFSDEPREACGDYGEVLTAAEQ